MTKAKSKLEIVNPNASGIDIGSAVHYVCVPEGRDKQRVQKFGCFTADLHNLARWLKKCKVTTVAMESTGVYWISLFQILESYEFEVKLVNARHVKNVPGRKSDVQDCQWLQQLHSYGLLRGSFRPDNQMCVLRSYVRQRKKLTESASTHVLRMQKALIQMNIQLHKVISNITGVTGMKIIEAIIEGERNPEKLAEFRSSNIKNDKATIAKALTGDYREEHLFVLKQELELYNIYQEKIAECDENIENYYKTFETKFCGNKQCSKIKNRSTKNRPNFSIHEELHRVTGMDFTKVPGLDALSIQTIISETGINHNKWPTEKHFSSWLGLSPANKITGEKVFSTRTCRVINRAANAFRMAAHCVSRSNSGIGAYCRRLKKRLGAPKAITATARKLACIFYSMLKHGQEYVEKGIDYYEKLYKERVLKNLSKKASELGYVLTKKHELI
ncbi:MULTISPECIES: IS110-like element ISWpi13 family transposase [Wolbachia]|uniref:IS110-like element ISWpi13 family transposase n=1 Tax=Wolbachia TaxID=953 RepID=UPI00019864B8|nr:MULTISPECIES: IS110-like element ISWpi13 family transposase [Wolbachia]MDX5487671.1 IS110-like element ISWpi13 family transposase [Wolbachia endosymbiont of Andrena praecox]MDX5497787.1 IS110-like element ISWpi13 family transposase [Wolbachia endosymbiont of Lasioglossum nitidulum]MDX5562094.1 IS110-like element ISWpi13 family transposase [Wolbachia endosymbiont of Andrena bicolor]POG51500.1 IS110 family transposase [Wolbachia sp. wRi_2]QHJ75407.1 mobile element protein [Wolbachia phage WO]